MLIIAGQHIFTNVEKEDSPNRERGFQTLYYTRDQISEDDKMTLEEHAFFWATPKIQFYRLGENFALANIVPLKETDKYGGEGLYISHALVISREEMAKISFNPWILLDETRNFFCTGTDSAVSRGDFDTGNIEPVEINIPDDAIEKFRKKTGSRLYFQKQDEVRKLAELSYSIQDMGKERRSLAIVGEQKEIEDILKYIFFLMPLELRSEYAFDTNYYNPRVRVPYIWAGGFFEDQSPNSDTFTIIQDGVVMGEDSGEPSPPFLNWLSWKIDHRDFKGIQDYNNHAYLLEKLIMDPSMLPERIKDIPPELVEEFVNSNRSIISEKVFEAIEKNIGCWIGKKTGKRIFEKAVDKPEDLLGIIGGNIDQQVIVESLLEFFSDSPPEHPDDEMVREIDGLISVTNSLPLKAILSFYRRDYELLNETLGNLEKKDRERFIRSTIGHSPGIEYFDCIVNSNNMDMVVDTFLEATGKNKNLAERIPDLLLILGRRSIQGHLGKFNNLLSGMSEEEKRQLIKTSRSMKIDLSTELKISPELREEPPETEQIIDEVKEKKSGGFLDKIWPFSKKQV